MLIISDYLIRATAGRGSIRALVATTTGLVEEARRRHNAYPTAAAALGRVLTAAALLGATLKDKQTLTIRVIGDGPLDGLIAEADSDGRLRGYLKNPQVDLPRNELGKLDVGGAVGKGFMCRRTKMKPTNKGRSRRIQTKPADKDEADPRRGSAL